MLTKQCLGDLNMRNIIRNILFITLYFSTSAQLYSIDLECANTNDVPTSCIEMQNYENGFPEFTIGVFFHIVFPDFGPGIVTNENIEEYLSFLNTEYYNGNISFSEVGRQIIRNSNYYNNSSGTFQDLVNLYSHQNAIDIYLLGPNGAGDSGAIPSNNVILGAEWIGSNIISHEIGHCLGLLHTHDDSIEQESVSGDNCDIAGDCVCDTPADPDTENIMSYTRVECLNHFTNGQFVKIHSSFDYYLEMNELTIQIEKPSDLNWTNDQNHPLLNWSPSTNMDLIGYNIYRTINEYEIKCTSYNAIGFVPSGQNVFHDIQIDIANMKSANNKARYFITSVHVDGYESFHSNKIKIPTNTREKSTVATDYAWLDLSYMNRPRSQHRASLLESGDVLISGGKYFNGSYLLKTNQCEIYKVEEDTWEITDSLYDATIGHTMTKLNNGNILVTGGQTATGSSNFAEIYNLDAEAWNSIDPLSYNRGYHSATKMLDGRVLIVAGRDEHPTGESTLQSCEIFDPQMNSFISAAPLNEARGDHAAILLNDGRVLVAAGMKMWGVEVTTIEIYDPNTNAWTIEDTLTYTHNTPQIELLNDGKVIITGNSEFGEIYDPVDQVLTSTEQLNGSYSYGHRIIRLDNGEILISGNGSDCELYNYQNNQWTDTSTLPYFVNHHALTRLLDGSILLSGNTNYLFLQDTTSTSITDINIISAAIIVGNNYPNPFNNSTKIDFILNKRSNIEFSIYNISGELIINTSMFLKEGQHSYYWDGKNSQSNLVSGGIYFITISNPNYSTTKKITFVK